MVRVAVIITARPSYAKLKPVIASLVVRGVDVQIIACASALLERYGYVRGVIGEDFPQLEITECYSTYEGANLVTSAKETGALLIELSSALRVVRPDVVVVCADRHEVLAAAQAASYLHLPLVHLQGGERTGSIDDRVRDAITHLADWHCVSTEQAHDRVYSLTGRPDRVFNTGCPSIDLACQALNEPAATNEEINSRGVGHDIDLAQPFALVLQHPVTNEMEQAEAQMRATLHAMSGVPAIWFWPGQDAGQEAMAKELRLALQGNPPWRAIRTLPPSRFLRLLSQASVIVGNSSAGIREASFLGIPTVNIGNRQDGRERAPNVADVPHDPWRILMALRQQMGQRYERSTRYGHGHAGDAIAEVCLRAGGATTRDDSVSGVPTGERIPPRVRSLRI